MSYYYPPAPPPPPPPAYWRPYDPRPRLDRLIAQMRTHDARAWGWRPAVLPCATLVVLIVAGNVVGHLVRPHTFAAALTETAVLTAALYVILIAAIYFAGRDLAARYSGWGWTFGLQRPKWIDGAWVAAGVGMVLVGRIVVVLIANAITHGTAGSQSSNLNVHTRSVVVYVVLGVIIVLIAPVVEETVFRGLLLRTLMWHWGFWPAALLSSAIFGLFHVYEVKTLAGAVTLAAVVFVLGMTNCLLARWSGRLAPGMIVHALFNGLAILLLALLSA